MKTLTPWNIRENSELIQTQTENMPQNNKSRSRWEIWFMHKICRKLTGDVKIVDLKFALRSWDRRIYRTSTLVHIQKADYEAVRCKSYVKIIAPTWKQGQTDQTRMSLAGASFRSKQWIRGPVSWSERDSETKEWVQSRNQSDDNKTKMKHSVWKT